MKRKALYYGLSVTGIGLILFALALSYLIHNRPFHFEIVGIVGLAGWGLASVAQRFRPAR